MIATGTEQAQEDDLQSSAEVYGGNDSGSLQGNIRQVLEDAAKRAGRESPSYPLGEPGTLMVATLHFWLPTSLQQARYPDS